MPRRNARGSRRAAQKVPAVEVAIFVVGLVAAIASGVVAYRVVGPYGDGFLDLRLYRAPDPVTGQSMLLRKVVMPDGSLQWYHLDESTWQVRDVRFTADVDGVTQSVVAQYNAGKLSGFERDLDGDGRPDIKDYYDNQSRLAKVGFSLAGNGVIDAWEYRNARGDLQKIEVSRRQDGKVDRTEYYEGGQLARVEEDDDHNGRVDRWLTYDAGILTEEAEDRTGDGKPDVRR